MHLAIARQTFYYSIVLDEKVQKRFMEENGKEVSLHPSSSAKSHLQIQAEIRNLKRKTCWVIHPLAEIFNSKIFIRNFETVLSSWKFNKAKHGYLPDPICIFQLTMYQHSCPGTTGSAGEVGHCPRGDLPLVLARCWCLHWAFSPVFISV